MRAAAMYGPLGALVLTAAAVSPAGGSPGVLSAPVPATGSVRQPDTARGTAEAAQRAGAAGIDWRDCPEAEALPLDVECGEVTVPLDYAAPDGRTIGLTVSRKPASGPKAGRRGPLLYNPGGPGSSGMGFPLFPTVRGALWKKLNKAYDFVGYAPRGVGRSAPLSCQDPRKFAARPGSSPPRTYADKLRTRKHAAAYARGCARQHGAQLRHFTTPDNARDLEVLRAALGEGGLSFYGVSWGTYLGSVYATLFPGHVRRLVLDSVVDPREERLWYHSNLRQNLAFERRWSNWKRWVAEHRDVYHLGSTPRQVQAHFDRARAELDRRPGPVGARHVTAHYVNVGYDDDTWAEHASALADFRRGDTTPLVQLVHPDPEGADAAENSNAVRNAVLCSDAPWPRRWERWERDSIRIGRAAPFHTWGSLRTNLPCAYWKTPPARPLDVGTAPGELPPVLLTAATRDAATPYSGAVETHRRLPGSSLVTERGAGRHGVGDGNKCVDAHIAAYLLHGRTPGASVDCAARAEPEPVRRSG